MMGWLIFLIIIGICFSGYMTVKSAREDKEKEDVQIEQEGRVYMERMEEEKEKRQYSQQVGS
ncbi:MULTISPECIES: sporulation YhaL family protein [Bacillus]|uniref:sporulation YhaL family protein n=1 Tax=Bacillus TaxID=1386 RepID=UPI001D0D5633|nr:MULTISPECIES: sporulation YhaL family protein [Bacillus]